ncbi:MAG TPA: response regulator transcription factor [Euzebyales bacterium]|nr:response regulator transcription factor [Euzebyales bacterium]
MSATDGRAPQILLVEDDDGIARPLVAALRGSGYTVTRVSSGQQALANADGVDAVVLDLGLPDLDGVEVCRRLRRRAPQARVLMLTARTTEADVVVGLDAGADDYVTKPFRLAELLARLRALLRRTDAGNVESSVLRAQDVRVDPGARRAWRGDQELELTPKEFDVLRLLVEHAGRVVTRKQLLRDVWETTWGGSSKTVDMHLSWLRRKLGDAASDPRYITTVRGVGFRFENDEHR